VTQAGDAIVPGPGRQKPARRRLRPEDRRAELLDAAMRILRERGPESCRIEDVTAEAATAKGNFYRYFPTWDDLLAALRDRILDSYRADLSERYDDLSSVDWWKALDDEIERFIDFQLQLGGLHDAIFHAPVDSSRPRETHRSAALIIATFLAAGIEHGAFAPVDVDVTAPLFFDVLHGAADAVASGTDRKRVLASTRHIVHRTLESRS
jgi:AcrR family transcriptional regulator